MRAVNLTWALENTVGSQQIVAIVSQSLSSDNAVDVREACEAFGVLWRLTGISAFIYCFILRVMLTEYKMTACFLDSDSSFP